MKQLLTIAFCLVLLPAMAPAAGAQGCQAYETDIIVGANESGATVSVGNTGTSLVVLVRGSGNWRVREINLYAGTGPVPLDPNGDPDMAGFPYNAAYATPQAQHFDIIPLTNLNAMCGDLVEVAIHAVLAEVDANGQTTRQEEGWATGDKHWPGTADGSYFCTEICCDTGACRGTAFDLTISPLQAGQPAMLEAAGLQPGDKVYFFASLGRMDCDGGSTLPPGRFGGINLDIIWASYVGKIPANAAGTAAMMLHVPSNAPPGLFARCQAVVAQGATTTKSDVVGGFVQP